MDEPRSVSRWCEASTTELRRLITVEYVSFSIAAERLKEMFPETMGNVTRNACIGKAGREDIRTKNNRGTYQLVRKMRKARSKPSMPSTTPRDEVEKRLAEHRANLARITGEAFEPEAGFPVTEKTGFSLIDVFNERKAGQCRWPHGDAKNGTFRYCCKPVTTHIRGFPYCNEHQVVATREDHRASVRKKQAAQAKFLEAAAE